MKYKIVWRYVFMGNIANRGCPGGGGKSPQEQISGFLRQFKNSR